MRRTIFVMFLLVGLSGCTSSRDISEATILYKAYKQGTIFPTYPSYFVKDYLVEAAKDPLINRFGDDPAWSPDGKWVAFSTDRYTSFFQQPASLIIILYIGKSEQYEIVMGDNYHPRWSPEGTKIAYDSGNQIWILDVSCFIEGKENCRIEPYWLVNGSNPDWSPNGEKIVFESNEQHIAVIRLSDPKKRIVDLTPDRQAFTPSWSPDGNKVVFSAYDDANQTMDILLFDYSSEKTINLTNGIGINRKPKWMKDGDNIVFVSSHRDGLGNIIGPDDTLRSSAIYVMDTNRLVVSRIGTNDDEMIIWYSIMP